MSPDRLKTVLLLAVSGVLLWSGIGPHDRWIWLAEVFPVLIALPLLLATRNRFPLTSLTYGLIALHACLLLIGGHYTYALTPLGEWLRDALDLARNPYDRIGHVAQGFVPAIIIRELLIRTSPLRPGKWLFAVIVFCCLGVSALYELIEWWAAALTGTAAEAFLATQGDVWDTQKDMLCAGLGAAAALLLLSKIHDRLLADLPAAPARR